MARHRRATTPRNGADGIPVPGAQQLQRRCAIYTRKSTEEGLDQGFNSLDAQREACEAYVLSQRHEGWRVLPTPYDDGGYSGGSMARPRLQALLSEVDAGRIDVVVVYKVDRLTRSLADFAKIVERFDARGVSFVSVTQAFNTTTSMGRLTLNVLLSFAQFEREVGAERVRDKVAASRKKGLWMGGTVPLGYRAIDRKLVIDPNEAATVRQVFALYLELGSMPALVAALRRLNVHTACRISSTGRRVGGIPFGPGPIGYLLHNRVYVGDVEHKGSIYPGAHHAILDRATFDAVQQKLALNANEKRVRSESQAILTGRIVDSAGNRMSPTHANKNGVRYRYYVSRALAEGRSEQAGVVRRVPAPEIEQRVLAALREHDLMMRTHAAESDSQWVSSHGPVSDGDNLCEAKALALVQRRLHNVAVHADRLLVTVTTSAETYPPDWAATISSGVGADEAGPQTGDYALPYARTTVLTLPWQRPPARPQRAIVLAPDTPETASQRLRQQLIVRIHAARGWVEDLTSGRVDSLETIARREGKHPRSIRTAMSFACLAPDLIARLLDGDLPQRLTMTQLSRGLPMLWAEQRRLWELTRPASGDHASV